MIKVTITKNQTGRIEAFEMSGHANFAEHGEDLVCAGASAVSFGAVNAIMKLTGTAPHISQGDDGGYLKVVFPEDDATEYDVQLLVNAMIVSLQTIELDYGQHIKIIFQK